MWRSDVRVLGRVYDLDDMKNFFGSKGLNFTNDYENMDISSIFNGDTNGACNSFDTGSSTTLGDCTLNSPYGKSTCHFWMGNHVYSFSLFFIFI
jgi:chitin synthase